MPFASECRLIMYYYYYYYLYLYLIYIGYSLVCPQTNHVPRGYTVSATVSFYCQTVYGAYLPRSYVGSDGLLRQHFPENVCSA